MQIWNRLLELVWLKLCTRGQRTSDNLFMIRPTRDSVCQVISFRLFRLSCQLCIKRETVRIDIVRSVDTQLQNSLSTPKSDRWWRRRRRRRKNHGEVQLLRVFGDRSHGYGARLPPSRCLFPFERKKKKQIPNLIWLVYKRLGSPISLAPMNGPRIALLSLCVSVLCCRNGIIAAFGYDEAL